jgi:hypothetical protein
MPSYTVHCRLSIELFGKSYYKLHKAIDSAFFFAGSHHRRYFHDYQAVLVFAQMLYPGDDFAVAAGKYHLELDWMFTEDPVLKWRLENGLKQK